MPQFFGRVVPDVHKMSKVDSGVTGPDLMKFSHNRGVIYAVNAHIAVVISHCVSEWQSNKCREVGNFAVILPQN